MNNDTSRVLTLVFTDLADSTALKIEHGDAAVGDLITRHRDHVSQLAERCGGRVIDWAGDGCFLTFDTSSTAVTFGLKLQQVHHYEADLPGVRIGIHMGEVTERPFDGTVRIEGLAVDLSARIGGLAAPGQVLISSSVHQSAKQRLGIHEFGQPVRWETYGPYGLKGFDEPLDVREAGLEGISPFKAPRSSEKAWPANSGRSGENGNAIRRIAVLPFSNLSGAADEDWFVDGMTETLIAELAKLKALTVISRTSVMFYKNANKPLPEIASELNVDAIVEGSAMRAGDRVRITAQLIRATDDAHLWADQYDGTMAEVFDLQSEVALAIAKEVNVAISPEDTAAPAARAPRDSGALEALMRAKHAFYAPTENGLNEALRFIERALEIDPECADAYALKAALYAQHVVYGTVQPADVYFPARVALQEAMALGGESSELFVATALVARTIEWNWDKDIENSLRALAINPSDAEAKSVCGFGWIYKGDSVKAHEMFDDAIDLDPLDPRPYVGKAAAYLGGREFEKAISFGSEVIRRFPEMPTVRANVIGALLNLRRFDEACDVAAQLVELTSRVPQYLALAGFCYACAGGVERTRAVLDELERRAASEPVTEVYFALLRLALGEQDTAHEMFERAYHERTFTLLWISSFYVIEQLPFEVDERILRLLQRVQSVGSNR